MATYDAWGWVGTGANTGIPTAGGSNIEGGLSNTSYAPDGSDLSYAERGTIVFDDGNGDNRIADTDTDDFGGTPPAGDRISVDGGTSFQALNEVGLYSNSTIDYTLPDSSSGTITGVTLRVFQLADGTIIMRMTNTSLQNAYDSVGFLPNHATGLNLGTYDGTDYTSMVPGNFDEALPCFTADTLIETDRGLLRALDLRPGDLVRTLDHGYQPVRWSCSRSLDGLQLAMSPHLRPIRIRAGALGDESPARDLIVSPQHRVLVRSKIAQRMFGADEVLVAAKQLLAHDGVELADDLTDVFYVHFLCERHEIVYSEGALTESLYPGPEALKSIGPAAMDELHELFPQLQDLSEGLEFEPARPLLKGREARSMAERHVKNEKPLVSTYS
jgi:hypothetical protein